MSVADTPGTLDENPLPLSCDACGQAMRLSYFELVGEKRQLNVFECKSCRTTATSVTTPSE